LGSRVSLLSMSTSRLRTRTTSFGYLFNWKRKRWRGQGTGGGLQKKGWANFYQVRGTVCCKSQQDSCCDPEDVGGVAVDLDDLHHHFRRLTGLKDLFFSFCLFCFVLLFSREKRGRHILRIGSCESGKGSQGS